MDIQERIYAEILDDTPCPKDQAVGCESCTGDTDCLIRIHDEFKCGHQLEIYGFECEICKKLKEQGEEVE